MIARPTLENTRKSISRLLMASIAALALASFPVHADLEIIGVDEEPPEGPVRTPEQEIIHRLIENPDLIDEFLALKNATKTIYPINPPSVIHPEGDDIIPSRWVDELRPVNPPVVTHPEGDDELTNPLVVPPSPESSPDWWRTDEFKLNPGLATIGVEHRYAAGATGKGTLGAIYDGGIDLDHEDVGRINIDLSHAYGTIPFYSKRIDDSWGHGTAVYGLIGASRNQTGIHGIAPDAEFMILKQGFYASNNDFRDALNRVTIAGADAMNNSWGLALWDVNADLPPDELLKKMGPAMTEQLRRTAKAGVSIIFGAGNDYNDEAQNLAALPAAMPELEKIWIAVTALNDVHDLTSPDLDKAIYASSCGSAKNWCLAAPADGTVSLKLGGGTEEFAGTSAAAPHVTGAVLVLKSQFPELSTPEIHQILFDTAVDIGAPGIDDVFGHGALNLGKAMTPQGDLVVELGSEVNSRTAPLAASWVSESAITRDILVLALSDESILVTDQYDRGYLANLGPRILPALTIDSPEMHIGLATAFSRARNSHDGYDGFNLRLDAFGPGHDVTRIAHTDPIMTLASQAAGTGFSMDVPAGKATLSMAHSITGEGNALSLGAGMPFGDGHSISVSLGHAREHDAILGARTHGAFSGLNSETVYGRAQADIVLGKRVTLNGSITAGHTSFSGIGLLNRGHADTRAMALGLTINDAFATGDKLSLALSRPLAVSGGQVTLRGGTDISSSQAGNRTNQISLRETTVPLGKADRATELHMGYMHDINTKNWKSANFVFGGIARLDGGPDIAAAQVALTLGF